MKKLLFFTLSFTSMYAGAQAYLNIMTFNIRLNIKVDSLDAWPYRKDKVASQILFHEAAIVGVQEALPEQMDDLRASLKGYRSLGVGREDGMNKGEFSAIFYDTARLKVLDSKTFWLSQTPDVAGSKGWDAALPRIVTWAKFKDKKTGRVFFHFNTHFDHIGKIARRESALLLLQKVAAIAGNTPVIISGDFNATPDDEPIKVITDPSNPLHLTDTEALSATPHYGPAGTFNGWKIRDEGNTHIDYIFTRKGVKVLQHATLSQIWGTHFSSDHFPVLARVLVQ